ncbi:MAG: hypothetical protein PHR47_00590 [Candidatus Pacebacteria bacterium]|nr:hypothetical protein [Candidatus Paceibacterota bacterium]
MNVKIKPPDILSICEKAGMSKEEVDKFLILLKRSMETLSKRISVTENSDIRYYNVERKGIGVIKTKYGKFWQYNFTIDDQWEKYSVIIKARMDEGSLNPIFNRKNKLVLRTDSGCETGQVFGDMTCECGEQLQLSMMKIAEEGEGMIIHIPRQDGRGMGLTFKLATLWMQDVLGVDTVESASLLAPCGIIDIRTYSGIICILKFLEIPKTCQINLATNNPKKAEIFKENGYTMADYVSVIIEPNDYTRNHLKAKQDQLGHKGLIGEEE